MDAKIDIYGISGDVICSVLITKDAVSHEELMTSDYIQLSWNDDKTIVLPAGAYIIYQDEKYSLIEPYLPLRENEAEYKYTPQFHSRIMIWDKIPVPLYTYESDGLTIKSREMDWDFTGSPADAMYMVKQAIKNETGEDWTIQLSESLPATITISSQSNSIFSLLTSIANECKTEWWADKSTNVLYLSQCKKGTELTLKVGDNVGVPTVTQSKDGYYTRFYVFGSTRNITQDYQGGQATNHIVNKRLTLDPIKYPGGYKDTKGHFDNGVFVSDLQKGEVFIKTLYFDDVYPKSKLTISDVRARLKYRLDTNGNKVRIGGTDEEPVYEQYAIWYFQISGLNFDPSTIIEEKELAVSFESGQLAGRDFKLTYHEKASVVNDSADFTPFNVKAGDFEINIDESTGNIIPGMAYIIPQNGDDVILYNIEMPDEYVASAQEELELELDKEMESYTCDNNSYEFDSYPVSFYDNGTDLNIGQSVAYVNGDKILHTRVIMVEKRLDFSFQQRIRIGNEIIKGNTQQLKEEVANVNQNIDVIKAFNELSISLSNAYANAQREMIEGFAAIKDIWEFDNDESHWTTDDSGNKIKTIKSKFNVWSNGYVSALGASGSSLGGSFDLLQEWDKYVDETAKSMALSAYLGKDLLDRVTSLEKGQKGHKITISGSGDVLVNVAESSDGSTLTFTKGNIDLSGYATKTELTELLTAKADKSIRVNAGTGLAGGGSLSADITLSLATVGTAGTYTKVTVDKYGRVTGHSSLTAADIPTLEISKINGLQAELNKKLNKTDFGASFATEMAKWFAKDSDGNIYVVNEKGFYSNSFISALGLSASTGGGGASYDRLDAWGDYDSSKASWVLSAKLGYDLNTRVSALEGGSAMNFEKSGTGNALTGFSKSGNTVTFTTGTFLTSHQKLYTLTLQRNGEGIGSYVPTADKVININACTAITMPKGFTVGTLSSVGVIGVTFASGYSLPTTAKQQQWDTAYSFVSSIMGSDADGVIDKWNEIISFLDGIGDSSTLEGLLNDINGNVTAVGNRVTTLEGYFTNGIAKQAAKTTGTLSVNGKSFNGSANITVGTMGVAYGGTGKSSVASGSMLYANAANVYSELATTSFGRNLLKANSGVVVTGLDADLLDGVHLGGIFTDISWSTQKLSLTIGGVTNSVTIPYATTSVPGLVSTGAQTFAGAKTFNAGLIVPSGQSIKIGGGTITWDSAKGCFHISHGLYSDSFISALGVSDSTGGGGGSSLDRLDDWDDYSTDRATWVLSAKLGADLNTRLKSVEAGSATSVVTTGSGNVVTAVTKSGTVITATKGITALTSHQAIYALTLQGNGSTIGTFNPKSANATINLTAKNLLLGRGLQNPQTGRTQNFGRLYSYYTSGSAHENAPTTYTAVIGFGSDDKASVEIAGGWTSSMGLWYRALRDVEDDWFGWRKVLDESNYASVLDSRYYTESEINTKLTNGSVTKVGTASVGSTVKPIYLNGGVPTALSANAGNSTHPVYLNAGAITQCGSTLDVSISGTAAKATALATARTINDVSFNGTANIRLTSMYTESLSGKTLSLDSLTLESGTPHVKWYLCPTDGGGSGITDRPDDNAKNAFTLQCEIIRWASSADYITKQVYTQGSTRQTWMRFIVKGTATEWAKVLDSLNYTSYTVTKTGGGASGTWGIGISGNAATASKLTTTNAGSSTRPVYFSNGIPVGGAYSFGNGNGNAPVNNGTVCTNLNADMLDGLHEASFNRIQGRYNITTTGTAPYNYIHLFRIACSAGYSTLRVDVDFRSRYHAGVLAIDITTQQYPYGDSTGHGSAMTISKSNINGRSGQFYTLKTIQESGYNYYDVYYKSGTWNSGIFDIRVKGGSGTLVFEVKNTNLNSLPEGCIEVLDTTYSGNAASATKLATARNINGTAFNGTADITTAKWGTARNIYIRDASQAHTGAAVSVDGSATEYLLLPSTITATLVGNASSATKLATARTINGTSFDGTENITTAKWGTARTIYIQDASGAHGSVGVSVDGSTNYNLKLPSTITATLSGNASTATKLQTARTLWGRSFDGSANVSGDMTGVGNVTPSANGTLNLGTATSRWANMYTNCIEVYGTNPVIRFHYNNSSSVTDFIGAASNGLITISNVLRIYQSSGVNVDKGNLCVAGKVVIGSTSITPSYDLTVLGDIGIKGTNGGMWILPGYASGEAFRIDPITSSGTSNSNRITLLQNGNVCIGGPTATSYKLDVSGTIYSRANIIAAGAVTALVVSSSSDARLKNIIRDACPAVEDVADAPAVEFAWKKDGSRAVGSIAQYWQGVLPQAVHEERGYLAMQYDVIAMLASIANARRILSIEKKIRELEAEVKRLKTA